MGGMKAYVLDSPGMKEVRSTLSLTYEDCCSAAFSYLYANKKWAKPYWKDWDWNGFVAERARRGWVIRECDVMIAEVAALERKLANPKLHP